MVFLEDAQVLPCIALLRPSLPSEASRNHNSFIVSIWWQSSDEPERLSSQVINSEFLKCQQQGQGYASSEIYL